MPFVHEIQIKSSGFPGAPGYTNLYFRSAVPPDPHFQFAAAWGFLGNLRAAMPAQWSGQIVANGRVLEETTGVLGVFTDVPVEFSAPRPGIAGGGFGAGVAGAAIGWSTGTINRGRLIRGRTFVVPLSAESYQADGTLTPDVMNLFTVAGQGMIAANVEFGVWSRPRLGAGGKFGVALSSRTKDQAAFLSSRRS